MHGLFLVSRGKSAEILAVVEPVTADVVMLQGAYEYADIVVAAEKVLHGVASKRSLLLHGLANAVEPFLGEEVPPHQIVEGVQSAVAAETALPLEVHFLFYHPRYTQQVHPKQEQRIVSKISQVAGVVEARLPEDLLQVLPVLLDHFVDEVVVGGGFEVDAAAGGLRTVLRLPLGVVVALDVLQFLLHFHRVVSDPALLLLGHLQRHELRLQHLFLLACMTQRILSNSFWLWSSFLNCSICLRSSMSSCSPTRPLFSCRYSRSRSSRSYSICSFSRKTSLTASQEVYIWVSTSLRVGCWTVARTLVKMRCRSSFSQCSRSMAKLLSYSTSPPLSSSSGCCSRLCSYSLSLQSMFSRFRAERSSSSCEFIAYILVISYERYSTSSRNSFSIVFACRKSPLSLSISFSYLRALSVWRLAICTSAHCRSFILPRAHSAVRPSPEGRERPKSMPIFSQFFSYSNTCAMQPITSSALSRSPLAASLARASLLSPSPLPLSASATASLYICSTDSSRPLRSTFQSLSLAQSNSSNLHTPMST